MNEDIVNNLDPARTRVAPSPTGDPHVGTAYMALFDLAWARKTAGQFVLRIEDTDRTRLVPGSEQQLYDYLDWLGLTPDEGPIQGGQFGPYRQSERLEIYRPYVDKLLLQGNAYYCWCSAERLAELRQKRRIAKDPNTGYDRFCYGKTREERSKEPGFSETPVVRMLIPDDVPQGFNDLIRGYVKAPHPDDQIILKTDGFPTYHLAVVVDDALMNISMVVRGEEWISSTPKHLLLYRWLGLPEPQYAHMPLLRNSDKSKISKRKNPAARLMWFVERGYLPEALRNFLQLLAYPPVGSGDNEEVSDFETFVQNFSWDKVNTTGPIFDLKKLDWLNGYYIRSLEVEELTKRIIDFHEKHGGLSPEIDLTVLKRAVPLVQERMVLLGDALPKLEFLFTKDEDLQISEDALGKLPDNSAEILQLAIETLAGLASFDYDTIHQALFDCLVTRQGLKPKFAFGPLRVALTGQRVSPPLFESMEILGRESTLARLTKFKNQL